MTSNIDAQAKARIWIYTLVFGLTTFLSSALLFSVQPMFGKMILPRVGGAPAAWTTCMLFFQVALLAGYAYAHLFRAHPFVHVALLVVASFALPIALSSASYAPSGGNPTLWMLTQLAASVGAPFVVIAASAPILQRWFPGEPYKLYAASNAGSLLALLSYPVAIEPNLTLYEQARWFSIVYWAFVVLATLCAWLGRSQGVTSRAILPEPSRVDIGTIVRWVALSFVPASLMIGATTYISTDIAAIPLLWVIPLALYLFSFIVVFAKPPAYPSPIIATAFVLLLLPLFIVSLTTVASRPILLVAHLALLFFGSLLFHGELVRIRPDRGHLTSFYLALATGGACAGIFNSVAPWLFTRVTEYPLTMVLACFLLPRAKVVARATGERERELLRSVGLDPTTVAGLEPTADRKNRSERLRDIVIPLVTTLVAFSGLVLFRNANAMVRTLMVLTVPLILCGALSIRRPTRLAWGLLGIICAANLGGTDSPWVRFRSRSFFGVMRVEDEPAGVRPNSATQRYGIRSLIHGTIVHGEQSLDPELRREPMAYYHRAGPVGQIFDAVRAVANQAPRNVGIIGLGSGGLAAYSVAKDTFTFFEIDETVAAMATNPTFFTWLTDAPADIELKLGDARISLAAQNEPLFDLLIIDAFSSDAIPLHLLTREAIALYLSRLAPNGLLAFHISNQYFKLDAPLGRLASDAGVISRRRRDIRGTPPFGVPSAWVIFVRNESDLGPIVADNRWTTLPDNSALWTDDFSNLWDATTWTNP